MRNFSDRIKEQAANFTFQQRMNKQYTPQQRIQEIYSILDIEIAKFQVPAKQQKLLQCALSLGHPLLLQCRELEQDLYIAQERVLIQLIKVEELMEESMELPSERQQIRESIKENYTTLEAINQNLYTVLVYKIKTYDQQLIEAKLEKQYKRELKINNALNQLFRENLISRAHINEQDAINYYEMRKQKYIQASQLKSIKKSIFVIGFLGLLFQLKRMQQRIFKKHIYSIIGITTFLIGQYLYNF